jgi:ABC-type antimicrobial peptide transport system permease subunit
VLAAIGAVAGGLLSLVSARMVAAFVWPAGTTDPATYVGVALVFLVVAAVASVIPALKILRLDPAETLRS